MTASARPETMATERHSVLRHWLSHQLSLVVPLIGLTFALSGPHTWWSGLLFLAAFSLMDFADHFSPEETRQPPRSLPEWPFDAMLYVLFAVQVATVLLVANLVSTSGLVSWDTLFAMLLIPGTSAFSIITAHELIHRNKPHLRLMGRIMMGLVLYEHFYTEHVRGHHRRVGTPEDPATARYGETFFHFYFRTVPGQFRSAWRLEAERLGDVDMNWWDPRLIRSRVVHGLVLQWGFALWIFSYFGAVAFAVHLVQAIGAFSGLEVVNYFEHWGLERRGKRVATVDSWDTTNRVTLYGLIGLSRHADHHAYASRPYQQLRHWEESPKLPRGYAGMSRLVFQNRRFRETMSAELERVRLGPFAPQTPPHDGTEAPPSAGSGATSD